MNLVSIKRTDDMKLDGITLDAEWRDKQLAALTLTDAKGNVVRLVLEGYRIAAYVPAPPERKKVHVVTGTVPTLGTPVREEYEHDYEAQSRKQQLEYAGVIENPEVKIQEIDIPF